MMNFCKYFHAFVVVVFLTSIAIPAYSQFTCNNFNAVNVPARANSFNDLGGDIIFTCSANGQPPTTPGAVVPSVNITVSANTNITSRILATIVAGGHTTNFNEALLIIDQPNTAQWNATGGASDRELRSQWRR